MGYTTTFTGEIRIDPPLNDAERSYLRKFCGSRRIQRPGGPYALDSADDDRRDIDQSEPPLGQPGLYCRWTPSDDGTALLWDGMEKFYRSSEWMQYLIDTFLRPGASLRTEMRVTGADHHPPEFGMFTFDHVLNGTVVAHGQDGAVWRIEVLDNEVAVRQVRDAAPVEYVVFVLPRHDDFQLDREFDAAFDLGRNQFGRFRDPGAPGCQEATLACLHRVHPNLAAGDVDGYDSLVDDDIGLRVTIMDDCIRIGLLAEPGLDDADTNFASVQHLVAELTADLGWVALDPAQRVAVRPTAAFRARAIDLIEGWTTEPEGRYMWGVM